MQQGELALLVCKPPYTLDAPQPLPSPSPSPSPSSSATHTSSAAAENSSSSIRPGPDSSRGRNLHRGQNKENATRPWGPRKGEMHYRIELCFWNTRALPPWELHIGDRIAQATGLKNKGTARFKAGNHRQALKRYKRAAKVISNDGADANAGPVLVVSACRVVRPPDRPIIPPNRPTARPCSAATSCMSVYVFILSVAQLE